MGRPKEAAHGFFIFLGHGSDIRHGLFYFLETKLFRGNACEKDGGELILDE
jgi:hypothetical protein